MCNTPLFYGDPVLASHEKELYDPVIDFLHSAFSARITPKHGAARLVTEKTALRRDPAGGQWTQPDIAAVCISRHRFAAAAAVDIYSFEVKTNSGGGELESVHEALAHARFANFAFLVWNRNFCTCEDHRYDAIAQSCKLYGVGLITAHNPLDIRTFDIRLLPVRSNVSSDAVDDFVATRFSVDNQKRVEDILRQFGSGPT